MRLPRDYIAGQSFGASYELDALPDEALLRADLLTTVQAYRALAYGGRRRTAPRSPPACRG